MMRPRARFPLPLAVLASLPLLLAACAEDRADPAADPAPPAVGDAAEAGSSEGEGPGDGATDDEESEPATEPVEGTAETGQPAAGPAPEATSADEAAVDCSAQGESITAAPAPDLPADVEALREFLIDAALRCDEQSLFTAIEQSDQFTYSFGGERDPLGYWWSLEETGEEPFLRLAQVLATTPALADGGEVYVWPRVVTGRPEDTTVDAWSEVTWLDDPEQQAADAGGYLDWRVGISADGRWRFFVAGD